MANCVTARPHTSCGAEEAAAPGEEGSGARADGSPPLGRRYAVPGQPSACTPPERKASFTRRLRRSNSASRRAEPRTSYTQTSEGRGRADRDGFGGCSDETPPIVQSYAHGSTGQSGDSQGYVSSEESKQAKTLWTRARMMSRREQKCIDSQPASLELIGDISVAAAEMRGLNIDRTKNQLAASDLEAYVNKRMTIGAAGAS
ncbi:hypothetical protein AB1Y20_016311 [Prymnesium parvum]|uniref:Uncharacterized protein n=1 Tax=Prymnesium parvum TaxID=97485 RepID=A0AB34IFT8_PRYPA